MADETDANEPANNQPSNNQPTKGQPDSSAGNTPPAAPAAPVAGSGGGDHEGSPPDGDLVPPPIPNEDADVLVSGHIRDEVTAALELADFIVKTGARTDGRSVPPELIRIIKVAAGKIRLYEDPASLKEPVHIKASDWARFELAYYALADFSRPVTVETLRDTRSTGEGLLTASPAQRFTWWLWTLTIVFAIVVLGCNGVATGADNRVPKDWAPNLIMINYYIPIIVPWAYGGLGACAYLLRTAHSLIAERAFDIRRKPEYMNRILLGMVSGGAIVLLFNPGDDDTVKISAAALGFVAGYSNDLLFTRSSGSPPPSCPRSGWIR
jgi:hypothetical protein